MKKYLLVLVSLCCALLPALAEHPEYPELRKIRCEYNWSCIG